MAEPVAFDQKAPPLHVTDPEFAKANPNEQKRPYQEYPRHLHRVGGEYVVVGSDAEKAAKLADGWYLTPDAAKAAVVQAPELATEAVDGPKKRGPKPKTQDAAA